MNKNTVFRSVVGATALAITFAGVAFADTSDLEANVNASVRVEAHASTTPPKPGLIQGALQNIKKEIGNDRAIIASTTKDFRENMASTSRAMASSTKDMKGQMKDERKDEKKDTRVDQRQVMFLQMARLVWIRINATMIRLQKIVVKLDTRIAKIKSAGGDTTVAERYSADAKVALNTAKSDTDAIKTIVSGISSTTPLSGTATSTIKSYSQDAEKQLKTARDDIEKAIQSLQGLKTGLQSNVQASTTTSVETH